MCYKPITGKIDYMLSLFSESKCKMQANAISTLKQPQFGDLKKLVKHDILYCFVDIKNLGTYSKFIPTFMK